MTLRTPEALYCNVDTFVPHFNMMLKTRTSLTEYLTRLQASGRVSFTQREALEASRLSHATFLKGAKRLQRKHKLFTPRHGFYVAVPPQFFSWKAPPPSWYIDDLMRHERRPYYVGLLKAAELHGATHHAVMEFQIVTDKQFHAIRAGRTYIVFHFRKDIQPVLSFVEQRKTDTGSMPVSSVELTCLDLVRYAHAVGGVDTVATVLADLGDKIDGEKLAAIAPHFERATVQRLGYLLDHLGHAAVAEPLHRQLLARVAMPWVRLQPTRRKDTTGSMDSEPAERNTRWRVIAQHLPEIDE